MIGETWKPIPSALEYEASSLGRIRSLDKVVRCKGDGVRVVRGRILTPAINLHGYAFISLCTGGSKKSTNVHRLVCEAFHGPRPSSRHEVAHRDGDQLNNRPENLRWATRKQNIRDKWSHGTMAAGDRHGSRTRPDRTPRGTRHPNAKLTDDIIRAIRGSGERQIDIAGRYGISQTHVSDIKLRKIWQHVA